MISLKPEIQKQLGTATIDQITTYLLKNFNTFELIESLAELLQDRETIKPIAITQEEFMTHFRLIGTRPDGGKETRGRRPKEKEDV